MNFSKRNKYTVFAFLIILNIIFRLPVVNHEIGVDSFFIHRLTTTISEYGYAKWIINPISFTGFYPMSYASASPFLLSGTSQIMGISIEYVILLLSVILGIFSVFSTFLFAKEVKDDDLFAFIVAFVFSLSPIFLIFTIWQASTRNLFMAFLPLLLWALIRCKKSFSGKYIVIVVVSSIFLLVSHKISLFIPLIFIAFIAALVLSLTYQKTKQFISSSYPNVTTVLNISSPFIFLGVFILLFFIQFSGLNFYNKLLSDFYIGYLFKGTDVFTIILNIITDYFSKMGILLIFGLTGFISLSRNAYNEFGKLFVIFGVLIMTPFMVKEVYTPEVILPFYSILVGFGIIHIYNVLRQRKKITSLMLVICLVVATGFSLFMIEHWNIRMGSMSDKSYATASFLKDRTNSASVGNSGLLCAQMSAFSGKACLPFGGAYPSPNPPGLMVYGLVKKDEVVVQPVKISDVIDRKLFYTPINALPNAVDDWASIMVSNYWNENSKTLISKYDIRYVIEDDNIYGNFWYWKLRHSKLLVSLHDSGNKIYVNGKENIYHLT